MSLAESRKKVEKTMAELLSKIEEFNNGDKKNDCKNFEGLKKQLAKQKSKV